MRIKMYVFVLAMIASMQLFADNRQTTALAGGSSWSNQSGSTLTIESVSNNGELKGIYINRESGYSCQNIPYPVTGWVYGTAITFTTIWESPQESCNSITAWTGFYSSGKITTLWQLVINGSTDPSQIIQGKDVFQPSTVINNKSLMKGG